MMKENYNTPNSGCCGRPFPTAPENKCTYNDCCMNEYAYKQKACIREKQPDCEAQAVIPSITVEAVDGITNLANCLVHVTSTNTTYYVDDKHRIMITWAGPVNIPGYDMETNPNHYKNQIVTDTDAEIAVIYDNNGRGFTFGIEQNADIEQIVNERISEMVASGYFVDVITPIAENTIDELASDVETGLAEAREAAYSIKTNELRKNNYRIYEPVTLPDVVSANLDNMFTLTKNGEKNYYLTYDESRFINTGGSTYYLSIDGLDTNDGSINAPFKTYSKFMTTANSGDTLIIKAGTYGKDRFNAASGAGITNKSVNIIGDGEVFVTTQDTSYVWTNEGSGVYSASRSGVKAVYDIQEIRENKSSSYSLAASLADCQNIEMSYYINGSTIYVHTPNGIEPDNTNTILGLGTGSPSFVFDAPTSNVKLYIENIVFLDGEQGQIVLKNNTSYNVDVLIRNVKLFNSRSNGYNYDGISNIGCNTICDNVEIYNSLKDGFNYHAGSINQAYGVEYNCKANNFGYGQTESGRLSNNASTAHNSCQVIRVNGDYSYCNGGCVVDINTAVGLLYNCNVYDSYGRSYDIYASDTAAMYVYDCYCKGSRANTNLLTNTNAHLYYNSGTEFDTKNGNCELIQ